MTPTFSVRNSRCCRRRRHSSICCSKIYADFGFTEILVKLSTPPPKRIGSDAVWDRAEAALAEALAAKALAYDLQPGEGAFYGPKIEFSLKDCLGRVWQCGTLQLDFALPQRLDAHYVGENNERHIPVMLHRAILGSLERFIGILIEHYAGAMPLWLSPVQAVVLNISEKQADYAGQVAATLRAPGCGSTPICAMKKLPIKYENIA
jgi:threonyl-tRNA synthetase